MSDSEIAELCRKLYRKHKHALDLIFMHGPGPGQGAVRDRFERLLQEGPDLMVDDSTKTYLRFAPQNWRHRRIVPWNCSMRSPCCTYRVST